MTDGRFFARLGIQTYGFLPMKLPAGFDFWSTVHGADERVPVDAVEFGADADPHGPRALRRGPVAVSLPVRWALTLPFSGVALHDHRALLEGAEAVGYDDFWRGETNGPDGFTPLALAAAWTERMRLGTGVVNAFTRGPPVLAQHAAALQDASRGRFCLGIGSSSNVIVERWNEMPFEKPLTTVRETVEILRAVLAGERGPGGFRLETPPERQPPIYVAALRGRMLRLGGAIGDGTFVNFLPLWNASR